MKYFKILFFISFLFFISCETNEKFSGSPIDNQVIETITGVVSSGEMYALPGQEVEVKAEVPSSFRQITNDTLEVQATSYSLAGSIRNTKIIILPGNLSGLAKLQIPGGDGTFDLTSDIKLTAINFKNKIPSKHFLIDSNTLTINSGNSSVPSTKDDRLKISLDWENKTIKNKLKFKIERIKTSSITITGSNGSGRINVGGLLYDIIFDTDLEITAQKFIDTHGISITNNSNVIVRRYNSDLLFDSPNDDAPIVSIVKFPNVISNTFNGSVFKEVNVGAANDIPKNYILSKLKLGATAELPRGTTISSYAYNEGSYKLKIGVTGVTDLATTPLDLKFRIILRFSDGKVQTFNGVYNGLTATSGFKTVLTIKKTGFGETSLFEALNFNPNP